MLDKETKKRILTAQKCEITEYFIYDKLSRLTRDSHNTVLFLIFPYLIFTNFYLALGFTILNAIVVILIFTFYISVARDTSFKKSFSEMALISLGIAALTFGIGFVVRMFFDVDI